jgi:hypothetical protein
MFYKLKSSFSCDKPSAGASEMESTNFEIEDMLTLFLANFAVKITEQT